MQKGGGVIIIRVVAKATSKVMEHIISSQVMRRLDINDVLHDAQHGFRKRRSCETQLLLSADDFLNSTRTFRRMPSCWTSLKRLTG